MSEDAARTHVSVSADTCGAGDIPAGNKHTEVGAIPADWFVDALSSVADIKTGPFGSVLHERDYVEDGTPIITVEHLRKV